MAYPCKFLLAFFVLFLVAIPIASALPYTRPGSALVFPVFASNSSNLSAENTKIVLLNTYNSNVIVRCTLIYENDSQCAQNYTDVVLPGFAPIPLNTSDLAPDKQGYLICAAVNMGGYLMNWNYLLGTAWFKAADGAKGSYMPLIYQANFSGNISNNGQLKLGTDYTPGAPQQVYVASIFSVASSYGNVPITYFSSSIATDAIWPATDIINASQNGVKNDLTLRLTNQDELMFSKDLLGNCVDKYFINDTFARSGDLIWANIAKRSGAPVGTSFGNLIGGIFTNFNPNTTTDADSFISVRETHRPINTFNVYLPFSAEPLSPLCGDNIVNQPSEVCDGTDLAGETCITQGYTGGTLACNLVCDAFDTGDCISNLPPQINITSPANGSQLGNAQNIILNVTVTDDQTSPLDCHFAFYLNGRASTGFNLSLQNNTPWFIPLSSIYRSDLVGDYIWNVNCSDGSLNNASGVDFTVYDARPPTIRILIPPSPENNSVQTSKTLELHANVTDSTSNVNVCILEFDGVNETMTKDGSGKSVLCKATKTLLDRTLHNFTVYANDTLGNMGRNGTWFFAIQVPGPPTLRGAPSAATTITEAFGGGTFNLFVGGTINFVSQGECHSAKLKTVTSGYATIEIYSSPITLTLREGESKDIDTNGNDLNDLRVELLQILLPDGARIKLTPLQESLPAAPTPAIYTYCGDGTCANGETAISCSADCAEAIRYTSPTAMFNRQGGSLVTLVVIMLIASIIYVIWQESKHLHRRIKKK